MFKKKTAKILGLFYIFLLYSSSFAIEEEENGFKEGLTEKDNFNEGNKKGNAFVKFFKYGKHSLLWRGINRGTTAHLKLFLMPSKNVFYFQDYIEIFLNLFSFCYDCKYMIKERLGLFFNCSCFGYFSHYDFLSKEDAYSFLNLNFGLTYVLLRKKNFLWNIYTGIGIMWGFTSPECQCPYYAESLNEKNILDSRNFLKSEVWKKYFYCKQFKQNIKHFDVIFDCSAFDFTIKDHFRVTLEWEGGIGNIYKQLRPTLIALATICLQNLSINMGYVF